MLFSVMPPRIRTRATKAQKENINTDNKLKIVKNTVKATRKPLADKTNSASDDTSLELPKKVIDDVRPRRDRRLPARLAENQVLNNKSNVTPTNNTTNNSKQTSVNETPTKNDEKEISSFKTPSKIETSLLVSRPRRICRLPSRFEDHSISPHKYIPIQPANASTPKQQSKGIPLQVNKRNDTENTRAVNKKQTTVLPSLKTATVEKTASDNKTNKRGPLRSQKAGQQTVINTSSNKKSPDTNNNPKSIRSTRAKKTQVVPPSQKNITPKLINTSIKKFFNKTVSPLNQTSPKPKKINQSFKVLESRKKSSNNNSNDIYEFTFDPNDEPKPQAKKRKRQNVKKTAKVSKPKPVVTYKSVYDQNISKALSALKNAVKSTKTAVNLPHVQEVSDEAAIMAEEIASTSNTNTVGKEQHVTMNDTGKTSVHEYNYASIRVEDIAAAIEPSLECDHDINYSPINSPRPDRLLNTDPRRESTERSIPNNDPLNLREELSFFDDIPVASSSMNASVRHPLASPWRVEFGSLPIKWHSNAYMKPNMTPAVESSFICSEDSNTKRHVYTNMLPENNEPLPEIMSDTPNLKQTSIISFIKEVAERKAKKKRGRSVSPTKAVSAIANIDGNVEVEKGKDPSFNNISAEASSGNNSKELENSNEDRRTRKRKIDENICNIPAKSPRKNKDDNCTYFGFDDSENHDQENLPPTKNVRGRSLRPRAVLQEINGPTRAVIPLAAKTKAVVSSEAVNKVYEGMKSAAIAPEFPEKNLDENETNIEDPSINDDSQSVRLFEDIDVVHHLKPIRKSYGKAKKVTFRNHTTADSGPQDAVHHHNDTSFEDDLADLTFEVPNIKEKKKSKKKPKKLMSKKEEKEAEEWAAGFNSMCEEIEDFQLVVE